MLCSFWIGISQTWEAPKDSKNHKNPVLNNDESINKGKAVYKSLCAACHGETGKGDVPAMQNLNPKPADLTANSFQQQTDGELFWKISEGKGLMASYKNMLSEKDRWNVVNYLRSLKSSSNKENTETFSVPNDKVDAFPFTTLINGKTTHIPNPKTYGFTIQHRFGLTKLNKEFITNLMGLDLAANMRIAFEVPINNKLMFDIGRTRYGKVYDIGTKYLLLQQTKDNKNPISIALYENIAINTDKEPHYIDGTTFEDGTDFEYKLFHRVMYDSQIIVSRKFSNQFSAQVTGQFIWRNLTPFDTNEEAYVVAVPISFRYKTTLKSAIDFEIMPNTHHNTFPISLGYEVASSGNHVFQITITNSDRLLGQNIFTNPTASYDTDGFMFGFNITRYF